ncbi:MAG: carboxypeptidase-like regulatory domain-containing protein, partial [Acidobacteriota bacterium]|nr:carboxypeptidase-like regulatory domain-containing protein [Acidobacteriota bacterium]
MLVAALLLATPALAQYGQIEGQVVDSTGAVLPGATVTAVNEDTGVSRSSTSDATGDYRLPALLPGPYTIRAELSGFQTVETTGVILTIQQTIVMNQELALAQVEETVTVTGTAPLLDTRRSDISTSVSDLQIQDLPVASRRWVDLALLTPGTSQDAIRGYYYRGNVNMGAGGRYYANAFIVDGVNNTWAEMG